MLGHLAAVRELGVDVLEVDLERYVDIEWDHLKAGPVLVSSITFFTRHQISCVHIDFSLFVRQPLDKSELQLMGVLDLGEV